MAVGDTTTITRTVTIPAFSLLQGSLTNNSTTRVLVRSVTSNNANVIVVSTNTALVRPVLDLTVVLANVTNATATATITATVLQVND